MVRRRVTAPKWFGTVRWKVPVVAAALFLPMLGVPLVAVPCKADPVVFEGDVEPITAPVVLRYRPYPRTTFSITQDMTMEMEGAPFSVRTTASGSTELAGGDAELVATVTIDIGAKPPVIPAQSVRRFVAKCSHRRLCLCEHRLRAAKLIILIAVTTVSAIKHQERA